MAAAPERSRTVVTWFGPLTVPEAVPGVAVPGPYAAGCVSVTV